MKPHSTDPGAAGRKLLREAVALALHDVGAGRAELHAAAAQLQAAGDAAGHALACCALVLFIGIADDDYTGFEAAAAVAAGALPDPAADPADTLLLQAGALTAGAFCELDSPALAPRAAAVALALSDSDIDAALRCCAGLAALAYHHISMDLAGVLWLELAMRPLLADVGVGTRLADEAFHMFVQSLYQCEAAAQAQALRQRRQQVLPAPLPVIQLKLLLLDAQIALGQGRADAGRQALLQAEALLDPRAPRPAAWWHLLRSRLDLLEGHLRPALVHARLALRLAGQSRLPERWMGVTVMQEGQVQVAAGQYLAALPFFERAGRAASGSQARFCWCLAHLARALERFAANDDSAGRAELAAGLAIARELAWLNFFRALPTVAAQVCTLALEHGIETSFASDVIAERGLVSTRPALAAWPWPVRVHTFGGLRIELQGQPLAFKGKVAKKPLELLLFVIAASGSEVALASAAYALWRDLEGDKARAALNVALHRLRKLLGHDEALLVENGRLSLNPRCVWVDCLAFEQLADAGDPKALALYRGAFLGDSEDEAWQAAFRARLAGKFKRLLTHLARLAAARGDGAAARALLERGLDVDPLAEDMARELIRSFVASGENAAALAVFERLRRAIALALCAAPAAATVALIEPLRRPPV